MSFNSSSNFQKGNIKGTYESSLDNYQCPDCSGSHFFKGSVTNTNYVQCVKPSCLRIDLLPIKPISIGVSACG